VFMSYCGVDMKRILSVKLILIYLSLFLASVLGYFLGLALGIWAAVLWDVAVIGAVLLAYRHRAMTRRRTGVVEVGTGSIHKRWRGTR
jgi:hypothetical protein